MEIQCSPKQQLNIRIYSLTTKIAKIDLPQKFYVYIILNPAGCLEIDFRVKHMVCSFSWDKKIAQNQHKLFGEWEGVWCFFLSIHHALCSDLC